MEIVKKKQRIESRSVGGRKNNSKTIEMRVLTLFLLSLFILPRVCCYPKKC